MTGKFKVGYKYGIDALSRGDIIRVVDGLITEINGKESDGSFVYVNRWKYPAREVLKDYDWEEIIDSVFKYNIGDIVDTNDNGWQFCNVESESSIGYCKSTPWVNEKIVDRKWSNFHNCAFYRFHASINWYTESSIVGLSTSKKTTSETEEYNQKHLYDNPENIEIGDEVIIHNLLDGAMCGVIGHKGVVTEIYSSDSNYMNKYGKRWVKLNPTCTGNSWPIKCVRLINKAKKPTISPAPTSPGYEAFIESQQIGYKKPQKPSTTHEDLAFNKNPSIITTKRKSKILNSNL